MATKRTGSGRKSAGNGTTATAATAAAPVELSVIGNAIEGQAGVYAPGPGDAALPDGSLHRAVPAGPDYIKRAGLWVEVPAEDNTAGI